MLTSQGGASMATLSQLIEHTARQNLTVFFHVLPQRFYFTHIYIPFILSLFN